MPKRSLQASIAGLQLVRSALERKNLTQSMLADPTEYDLASWSTINNFFTGKRVDRKIFIKICEALDLEWEDVVNTGPPPEPINDLKAAVLRQAQLRREALNPRILERIDREIVDSKFTGAIQRGLEGIQRIIPIVAPAGYGKSTIVGSLYDKLLVHPNCWIGLILCNSLTLLDSPTAEHLAVALGESVAGMQRSIVEIATQLNATERGLLLIDTLDLILDRTLVPPLSRIFAALLEAGTTLVFTCRDREYHDFLEPTSEKLPGLAAAVDRYHLPEFTRTEVYQAATAFVQKQPAVENHNFADKILALSADNRSLGEIVCNPLLLALLCDLFAKDGRVPQDLTVSKLYKKYWQEKVAYSRVDRSHSALLAIEKEKFCLNIAKALFDLSGERLCESAYLDELGIDFSETTASAYRDLLSEGVLERLPSQKIHFFHQTLLEYAIAYWLLRQSSLPQRQQLIATLSQPETGRSLWSWWSVMRQLLTIAEDGEFETVAQQLNTDRLEAFRAVIFAAASRDTPAMLRQQLPLALTKTGIYQKILRQALESASTALAETAWDATVEQLKSSDRTTASTLAQHLGSLLTPWQTQLGSRLRQVLKAVGQRNAESAEREQAFLWGAVVESCTPLLRESANDAAFSILCEYYPSFAEGTQTTVIRLHLDRGLPDAAYLKLWETCIQFPLPKRPSNSLKQQLIQLAARVFPQLLTNENHPWFDSVLAVIHHPIQTGWDRVCAAAVGRYACQSPEILDELLTDLLTGDPRHTSSNLIALDEASLSGVAADIAKKLVQFQGTQLERLSALAAVIKSIDDRLTETQKEQVIDWCNQPASQEPERWLPILIPLAKNAPTVQEKLVNLLEQISEPSVADAQLQQLLRVAPSLKSRWELNSEIVKDELATVEINRLEAVTSNLALSRLIVLAQSPERKPALESSKALLSLASQRDFPQLLDSLALVKSPYPGVRFNALEMIQTQIQERQHLLSEKELAEICTTFEVETQPKVIQKLCEIVTAWIDDSRTIPPCISDSVDKLVKRATINPNLEGGVAGALLDTLNVIAQLEDNTQTDRLSQWTKLLLHSIDFKRVQESKAIDLVAAIARVEGQFFPQLLTSEFYRLPWRNQRTIILSIRRVEGVDSPWLNHILQQSGDRDEIASLILEMRGA
ncbi:helix-turn-helix domain-containing protein [Laspinema sp. D1]|uniref:Helix-turn-helix domain-containing protein n=1 Tax=Laspinema palackyanum D2a TaxID=2953684 RepID=A0ABT2MK44_9CYAN|nr:helix-turn-helix domain-containing protein [Laspinema sp. D2a]